MYHPVIDKDTDGPNCDIVRAGRAGFSQTDEVSGQGSQSAATRSIPRNVDAYSERVAYRIVG
jgi:hypothetical protein